LGRPFLCTIKAIIYVEHAKIVFTIKDKKEKVSFKNRMLHSPAHPQAPYKQKESVLTKKKKNNRNWRKNKASHAQDETIKMINTIISEYDHLLTPFLIEKDDPGVPTIECIIN
jgi:precorrin-2 methylase